MSFFTQTRASGPGRFLQWKVRLFAVAAVVLLVGMAREIDWLVGVAIALLAVAFVLRFFEKEPESEDEPEDDEDYDDEEHAVADEPAAEARRGVSGGTDATSVPEEPRRPLE
jgi:membrane protein implicated in regulation of membrane protease activity